MQPIQSSQPREALTDLDLGFQWKKCDDLADPSIKVQSLHIGPDPIKIGANISIDFEGSYTSDETLKDPVEVCIRAIKRFSYDFSSKNVFPFMHFYYMFIVITLYYLLNKGILIDCISFVYNILHLIYYSLFYTSISNIA